MKTFQLTRASDSAQAIATAAKATTAQQGAEIRFIGGGTTLIDLMKLNVEQPQTLIDINRLPLDKIEALPDGGLTIGAVVRNSDLAYHPLVRKNYTVLSEAILSGASVQLRNMATTAGNLLQRTRCMYFRDTDYAVQQARARHRVAPPSPERTAVLAILGTSEHCIATNPSDMNVAMAALEATIHVRGTEGRAEYSDCRLSRLAWEHAATRDGARAGRSDYSCHASAARAGKPLALFEIARPRFLRICARFRRGSGHGRERKTDACSHCARWRGHEALEVD